MGQCILVLSTFAFACYLLPFCVYSYKFAYEDGSERTSKRCECDSVEFWLARRTNGAPKLLSYEATESNSPSNELFSKTVHRFVRLWLPQQICEISLGKAEILQENRRQNVDDGSIKILFKVYSLASCLTATLKCKQKTICVGIDTRKMDADKSTQRKLLMFKNDESKETFIQQPYSILLSVMVFCSMVVLLALCGKADKNLEKTVARDSIEDIVTMVSSEKVKSTPRQPPEKHNQEENTEVLEIKVEGSRDSNSNWSDIDLAAVTVTGDDLEGDGAKNSVDGAVFGKQKSGDGVVESKHEEEVGSERKGSEREKGNSLERSNGDSGAHVTGKKEKRKEDKEKEKQKYKEDKRKEKEVKSKDRSKDMRSKRSHTAPAESTEQKSMIPKMRLSLKTNTSGETSKKDKKKSKKKSDDDSPLANSPTPFAGDRRSLVNRELPKRPLGDSTAQRPSEEHDNSEEDDNYETVVIQKGPPRDSRTLKVPSSNAPADRGSLNYDTDASLYDSVDDTIEVKPQGRPNVSSGEGATAADTYEIVQTKPKTASSTLPASENAAELYESVSGEYEQPNIKRQRSFSEITPSTQRTNAEPKVMSLGREKKTEVGPTPPPLDHLRYIAQMAHDDIEPYTVTVKKGDLILQEEASIAEWKGPQPPESSPAETEQPPGGTSSPQELEKMYAKVNKEKQIKDRMETEKEEKTLHVGSEETTRADGGREEGTHSVSVVVGVADHQYETFPRERDSFHETEDARLYEEVDTKDSAKPKQEIAYV